jgi:hypothetical protein
MNTHDELERLLGDELRDRAGDMGGARLQLDDVRGRASSIRRRRRIATGVGVAAALAVIVPTAVALSGGVRSAELPPANPSPQPPAHTVLTLDGLSRGNAAGIEYFTEDGVVLPGQGLQPLDRSWQALVPSETDGGWLALSPSRDEVATLDDDFKRLTAGAATGSFVSNPDRSLVSWTFPESGAQTLYLHPTTGPWSVRTWDFPETPVVDPVDFTGNGSLVFQTTTPQGRHEVGLANSDGTTTMLDGYVKAISASPATGLVAVQTRENRDSSGCLGVIDPETDPTEPVWQTCGYSLGAFSPDGKYVLASTPYLSGFGVTSVAVLDARTGALVASFDQPRNGQLALVGVAWETGHTFLSAASEGTTTTVLRFDVDGTLDEVADPIQGEPYSDLGYYLGTDRLRGF